MPKFIGKKCEIQVNFELKDGEYLYILVTHDKTTFQLNDKQKSGWIPKIYKDNLFILVIF